MTCARCSRPLPSAFPGATVTCGCGAQTTLAVPHAAAGPYRAPSVLSTAPDRAAPCPFCGNLCPPLVRVCPHCDVRLENVRCVRCYSLQEPGTFTCRRCGEALELEPLLDATDAPCPRCRTPLEAAGAGALDRDSGPDLARPEEGALHECPRCGGIFVPRAALVAILERAELHGAFTIPPRTSARALETVVYLRCPLCHTSMNRLNFGKRSGVIVDDCRPHGTWFDAGELTRVIAFTAGGGLRTALEADRPSTSPEPPSTWRELLAALRMR